MKSIKKNFIYNLLYQILILLIPLVTVPYVSRVIGSNGIGIYSYTYSIVYYFMIFSMLGLNNYGNRTIAKVRDNNEKLSITFKEIHLLQIITTTIMLLLYVIFLALFKNDYFYIFIAQSLYLISCMFDINWFYYGMEEFKLIITRNIIIKIISLVLIFLLVRTSKDVMFYTIILSGSTLISQLSLWLFINKYINIKQKIKIIDIKKHFIPCVKLLLPVIAVAIYKIMDKTMLGLMTNVSEVGYYENAEKIINVLSAITAALGTVMLPRMSNMFAKGEEEKGKLLIEKSINVIMMIAFPLTFGVISISKDFSILFFGKEFYLSGVLIIYLSITIIFLAWGNVIRTQYLIPKEMDKEFIISAFLGAIVNLIFNLIFIPKFGSVGACIGTIAAEFVVVLYQTIKIKDKLPIKRYLKNILPFILNSMIMLIVISMFDLLNIPKIYIILLKVFFGGFIYMLLNIKTILSLIDSKNISNKIKSIIN